jgi:hypothetical protein
VVSHGALRGLADTLRIGSFRYNQHFQDYDAARFLHDLFNNPNVRYLINNVLPPPFRSSLDRLLWGQSSSRDCGATS